MKKKKHEKNSTMLLRRIFLIAIRCRGSAKSTFCIKRSAHGLGWDGSAIQSVCVYAMLFGTLNNML